MNELKLFSHPMFGKIRVVSIDNEPWMVGKDVAEALGYKNTKDAIIRHVDPEDKQGSQFTTSGQAREMTVINESGLYSLVLSSKLPEAKRFRRWVTNDVLPAIRRQGGYIHATQEMTPEEIMAKALQIANATIENQKAKLNELATENNQLTVQNQLMSPKADYFDEIVNRHLLTNIRDTAKELHVKQNAFVTFLLNRKYLYRDKKGQLQPSAKSVEEGLFEVKESFNEKTDWSGTQTLVTPKGRETFRLLMIQ